MFPQFKDQSTMYPNNTDPLPPAPDIIVPSLFQPNFINDPHSCLLNEWLQPLLSQIHIISNDPTANTSPDGFHLIDVIT